MAEQSYMAPNANSSIERYEDSIVVSTDKCKFNFELNNFDHLVQSNKFHGGEARDGQDKEPPSFNSHRDVLVVKFHKSILPSFENNLPSE
ncbi:hypothetical protein Tco_0630308 [Tanacetum coccineum]|uniref:Uncharacterized protein n=1 Tax=Tanacetum coccineum TaxID=301880 RepID=A0ABQ5AIK0_9ASTR